MAGCTTAPDVEGLWDASGSCHRLQHANNGALQVWQEARSTYTTLLTVQPDREVGPVQCQSVVTGQLSCWRSWLQLWAVAVIYSVSVKMHADRFTCKEVAGCAASQRGWV